MKKIFLLFVFVLIFSSCATTKKRIDLMTTKVSINENVKEYSYLEAKAKALDAVRLTAYNPVILNASYSEEGYSFVFFPLELGKIFAVNVKRYTGAINKNSFKNIAGYDYIDREEEYISADLALNIALGDANISVPNGYSYRVWMEPFDGNPVFFVVFGDAKNEYKYTIDAHMDDQKIMSKDVIVR